MPRQSITELKSAIEAAPEITAQHREQLLELVASLEKEVAVAEVDDAGGPGGERAEKLRGAISVTGEVVRRRVEQREQKDSHEDHDLRERLSELEEKVEMVAVEHPVIANVLAAIARLV